MLTYKFNNSIKSQTMLNDNCRCGVYSGMCKFVVRHQHMRMGKGEGYITTRDMMLMVYTGVREIVNPRVLSYYLLYGFI